jgi:hypothetical protein
MCSVIVFQYSGVLHPWGTEMMGWVLCDDVP